MNNTASQQASHAEGRNNTVSGANSHVGGSYNSSADSNQTVVGKYNDNKSTTLFEVGNGSDANNRSNAFEVHSDGHINVNGDFYQNGSKVTFGGNSDSNEDTATSIVNANTIARHIENRLTPVTWEGNVTNFIKGDHVDVVWSRM